MFISLVNVPWLILLIQGMYYNQHGIIIIICISGMCVGIRTTNHDYDIKRTLVPCNTHTGHFEAVYTPTLTTIQVDAVIGQLDVR